MVRLETEALIDAPPDTVWRVLTDFARYPEWNPLILEAVGEARMGGRVAMRASAPDGSGKSLRFTATLVRVEPGVALEWKGGVPLVLSGLHYFRLSPSGGGTRLVHGEDYFGLYPRLVGKKRLLGMRPAYEGLNAALVKRVAAMRVGTAAT
ncbi:SRPBCC domain-containing protein [Pyxidicoccus fallax]|uniref:SRPBCC domain-containing protein n=1 Tax=Pyxidicoccus fallax TaxID=394095 RepID=A0A848M0K2_9BACT|nr:SRPBCC domain-containing protein [Pyxidicoccus fallax]NMO23381.1 SRPBCC domain-containing protein [Pyxidicoccus fallax]NPC86484.1 SRPBCC domain-containing protein [Pyxidicoccus fallax]